MKSDLKTGTQDLKREVSKSGDEESLDFSMMFEIGGVSSKEVASHHEQDPKREVSRNSEEGELGLGDFFTADGNSEISGVTQKAETSRGQASSVSAGEESKDSSRGLFAVDENSATNGVAQKEKATRGQESNVLAELLATPTKGQSTATAKIEITPPGEKYHKDPGGIFTSPARGAVYSRSSTLEVSFGDVSLMRAHAFPKEALATIIKNDKEAFMIVEATRLKEEKEGREEKREKREVSDERLSVLLGDKIPYIVVPRALEDQMNNAIKQYAERIASSPKKDGSVPSPMIKEENTFAVQFPWLYWKILRFFYEDRVQHSNFTTELKQKLRGSLDKMELELQSLSNRIWGSVPSESKSTFFGQQKLEVIEEGMIRSSSDIKNKAGARKSITFSKSNPLPNKLLSKDKADARKSITSSKDNPLPNEPLSLDAFKLFYTETYLPRHNPEDLAAGFDFSFSGIIRAGERILKESRTIDIAVFRNFLGRLEECICDGARLNGDRKDKVLPHITALKTSIQELEQKVAGADRNFFVEVANVVKTFTELKSKLTQSPIKSGTKNGKEQSSKNDFASLGDNDLGEDVVPPRGAAATVPDFRLSAKKVSDESRATASKK